MEDGVGMVPAHPPAHSPAPAEGGTPAGGDAPASRRRSRLKVDLALLAVVGVMLVAATTATVATLYRDIYSPTAFVERYLGLLSEGRGTDALALPGVTADADALTAAGLPADASDALLRGSTLAELSDIAAVSERRDGDITRVTMSYVANGHAGTTTFEVEADGWIGVTPAWRFARSPIGVLELTVRGAMRFSVNGFEVDKRQVSAEGMAVDALDPLPMLVFSPGAYRVSVDTAISETPGVEVLADTPLANTPVDVQAEPTKQFVAVVQERVDDFLAECATQQVLQPTACPFGYVVTDRIDGLPKWKITQTPTITVEPKGADWVIPAVRGVARVNVDVVSLFDGTVQHVREDVPFIVTGNITVLPDGTASIRVGGAD
ncbi:MAG: hypothetical protein QM611_08675 [Microbacterium sp.]|uniref:hypothetical protein n=1 Tax=Microbacterium sp. TaxID=51671 RepID=UPI0039E4352B